jgi:hypothetical protein
LRYYHHLDKSGKDIPQYGLININSKADFFFSNVMKVHARYNVRKLLLGKSSERFGVSRDVEVDTHDKSTSAPDQSLPRNKW